MGPRRVLQHLTGPEALDQTHALRQARHPLGLIGPEQANSPAVARR